MYFVLVEAVYRPEAISPSLRRYEPKIMIFFFRFRYLDEISFCSCLVLVYFVSLYGRKWYSLYNYLLKKNKWWRRCLLLLSLKIYFFDNLLLKILCRSCPCISSNTTCTHIASLLHVHVQHAYLFCSLWTYSVCRVILKEIPYNILKSHNIPFLFLMI